MINLLQSNTWLFSPWAWALLTGACALWLLVPRGRMVRWQIALGSVLGVIFVGLLASRLTPMQSWGEAAMFWLLAAVTVVSATAMISMRSPVYCAIWFAMTLLGTSCLFLLQGAQFLAVATIVVYAGAIVVMFLFLIMLAQPEGNEYYDRISWNSPAALASSIAGALIVLLMTIAIVDMGEVSVSETNMGETNMSETDMSETDARIASNEESPDAELPADKTSIQGPQAEAHVATLGGVLFSRYLIAVEVAGTLLLVALVGAVAIVIHGRQQERSADNPRQLSSATESNAGGDV